MKKMAHIQKRKTLTNFQETFYLQVLTPAEATINQEEMIYKVLCISCAIY